MLKFPMKFEVSSESTSGIQSIWSSKSKKNNQKISIAIPAEFEGPGGGESPEDLYAMALQNCFIATFKVYAEKLKLAYESIHVYSTLEVDRDENGKPWMARIDLNVTLKGITQQENALRLLEKISQSCMILNSVNTKKSFNFEIVS